MGKHAKQKLSKKAASSAPYKRPAAKPTVSVTYDGDAAGAGAQVKSKKGAKADKVAAMVAAKAEKKEKKKAEKVAEKEKVEKQEKVDKAADIEVDADAPAPTFKIVAGSYEKILYGLEGSYAPGATEPTLTPIFIFPAHLAMIKTVAASPGGKWLATGSEDEFIKVWDLRRRKEVGSLSQHTGELTEYWFSSPATLRPLRVPQKH